MAVTGTVKERLAGCALELFEQHGYENTTVDDIVERAGVGRTTFFRTFGSKEDVLFPHHEPLLASVRSRLAAATAETGSLALVEAARVVLRHYLAEGDVARARYRLTSSVPALRQREVAGMQAYQWLFREVVAEWLGSRPGADRSRAELQAELIAAVVVTAHNHVLRQWLRGSAPDPEAQFDVAIQEAVEMYARAIRRTDVEQSSVVVFRTDRDLETILPALKLLIGDADQAAN